STPSASTRSTASPNTAGTAAGPSEIPILTFIPPSDHERPGPWARHQYPRPTITPALTPRRRLSALVRTDRAAWPGHAYAPTQLDASSGLGGAVGRPAPRTGATRHGPRPPGASCGGHDQATRQTCWKPSAGPSGHLGFRMPTVGIPVHWKVK